MPATLIIKRLDNTNAVDGPGRWRAGELVIVMDQEPSGSIGEGDKSVFYTFTVTDKTPTEMKVYLETYAYNISMDVYAGPDPSGLRRIRVKNDDWNANYSPDCDWTTENTGNITQAWNETHPDANLIILDIPAPDYFECEGTFTAGEASEFEALVIERGLEQMVRRAKWYISPSGMTNIGDNGGHQEGTAQQLGGILKNRVLD